MIAAARWKGFKIEVCEWGVSGEFRDVFIERWSDAFPNGSLFPEWIPTVEEAPDGEDAPPVGVLHRTGRTLWLGTVSGRVKVAVGDWIVRDVGGELVVRTDAEYSAGEAKK